METDLGEGNAIVVFLLWKRQELSPDMTVSGLPLPLNKQHLI